MYKFLKKHKAKPLTAEPGCESGQDTLVSPMPLIIAFVPFFDINMLCVIQIWLVDGGAPPVIAGIDFSKHL